ncbi:MAG: ABC transporter ATP-binding protein [Micromonosporaceae bacterium]
MLIVERLTARYGEATALREVTFEVPSGQVVTLVGRNGAGKTTLLRSVMGLHHQVEGRISLDGESLERLPAHRRARCGLGWVPDDRGAYAGLTVAEHLALPPEVGPDPWPLERVYDTFPVLADRRRSLGTQLSGGEQQMLAMARVLRMGARLLLCDEPTEGLAPRLVQQIGEIIRTVKAAGVTVLLVEQNVHFAMTVADTHHLLAEGRLVQSITNDDARAREDELLQYLGI